MAVLQKGQTKVFSLCSQAGWEVTWHRIYLSMRSKPRQTRAAEEINLSPAHISARPTRFSEPFVPACHSYRSGHHAGSTSQTWCHPKASQHVHAAAKQRGWGGWGGYFMSRTTCTVKCPNSWIKPSTQTQVTTNPWDQLIWRVMSTNQRNNTQEETCTIAGTVILYRCFLTDGTDTKASASIYTTADNKSTLSPRLPDSCVRL